MSPRDEADKPGSPDLAVARQTRGGQQSVLFQCAVEGWLYEKRETAEAHIKLQHGSADYDAYLIPRQGVGQTRPHARG